MQKEKSKLTGLPWIMTRELYRTFQQRSCESLQLYSLQRPELLRGVRKRVNQPESARFRLDEIARYHLVREFLPELTRFGDFSDRLPPVGDRLLAGFQERIQYGASDLKTLADRKLFSWLTIRSLIRKGLFALARKKYLAKAQELISESLEKADLEKIRFLTIEDFVAFLEEEEVKLAEKEQIVGGRKVRVSTAHCLK